MGKYSYAWGSPIHLKCTGKRQKPSKNTKVADSSKCAPKPISAMLNINGHKPPQFITSLNA